MVSVRFFEVGGTVVHVDGIAVPLTREGNGVEYIVKIQMKER